MNPLKWIALRSYRVAKRRKCFISFSEPHTEDLPSIELAPRRLRNR